MSDFDFDELDKAVTSALGVQASASTDTGGASSASTDDRTSVNTQLRQSNIAVPSRSETAAASPALHSRTMQSRRVPRYQESAATSQRDDAQIEQTADTNDSAPVSGETSGFSEMNDAVNSIVDDISPTNQSIDSADVEGNDSLQEESEKDSTQKPNLPTRRAGRFMDVVHPSSDMKTVEMSPRKSPTIAPLGFDESTNETTELAEGGDDTPLADEADIALQNGMNPDDVPAPIDLEETSRPINTELSSQISSLLGETDTPTIESAPEPTSEITPAPQPEVSESPVASEDTTDSDDNNDSDSDGLAFEETPEQNKAADDPQTSPFLEGVTVSKRPLGDTHNPLGEEQESSLPSPAVSETTSVAPGYKEEVKHPDDATPGDVLPDELSGDLVSIEATESTDTTPVADEATSPKESTPPAKLKKAFAKEAAAAAGPTSIAKQYKEKPRTDDASAEGDIFDTKNYHKPLKDADDKKSVSPIVLVSLILAIVILVAGGVFFAWWSGMLPL